MPPLSATLVDERRERGFVPVLGADPAPDRVRGALPDRAAGHVDAAHPRLRGERDQRRAGELALSDLEALLGEDDDRAALGRLVGETRELRGVGELALEHARQRQELGGLPVAERDRAGLVEQERRAVTGGFDRTAREREHVPAHEPVHAGDPDRGEQRADRGRDQADEQRDEHDRVLPVAGVDRERLQRHDREQEDRGQADEQDVERDLVRRLLPRGALDERDHPVEEALAGPLRHADDDLVGEHARAAGHRRTVAARLADDRRGLAGDRRLVDAGDPFDHLAVGRDHLARRDHDDVTLGQSARRDLLDRAVGAASVGGRLGACPPQRLGLRLAAALRHRLREVGEEDGEPEPDRDQPREHARIGDRDAGDEDAADLDDEHHRVPRHPARVELAEAVGHRPAEDRRLED